MIRSAGNRWRRSFQEEEARRRRRGEGVESQTCRDRSDPGVEGVGPRGVGRKKTEVVGAEETVGSLAPVPKVTY